MNVLGNSISLLSYTPSMATQSGYSHCTLATSSALSLIVMPRSRRVRNKQGWPGFKDHVDIVEGVA